jgi:hypothetical protein
MIMYDALPLKVAYSLGLLMAHCCTGTFHNKWIEFSTNAKFHKFPEGSLYKKIKSIRSIVERTNLLSVFQLLLNTYHAFDVPPEKQIRRVFIFTDGQWNQMTDQADVTTFQNIDSSYQEAGYERPEIVFWNLRAGTVDFPVICDIPRIALISGFSSDLLQLFLDGGDMSPLNVVLKAIDDNRYKRICL